MRKQRTRGNLIAIAIAIAVAVCIPAEGVHAREQGGGGEGVEEVCRLLDESLHKRLETSVTVRSYAERDLGDGPSPGPGDLLDEREYEIQVDAPYRCNSRVANIEMRKPGTGVRLSEWWDGRLWRKETVGSEECLIDRKERVDLLTECLNLFNMVEGPTLFCTYRLSESVRAGEDCHVEKGEDAWRVRWGKAEPGNSEVEIEIGTKPAVHVRRINLTAYRAALAGAPVERIVTVVYQASDFRDYEGMYLPRMAAKDITFWSLMKRDGTRRKPFTSRVELERRGAGAHTEGLADRLPRLRLEDGVLVLDRSLGLGYTIGATDIAVDGYVIDLHDGVKGELREGLTEAAVVDGEAGAADRARADDLEFNGGREEGRDGVPGAAAVKEDALLAGAKERDFGDVKKEGDMPLELGHDFELRNVAGKALTVKGVSSSCGCVVSKASKEVIEPGEAVSIHATLRMAAAGRKQERIWVDLGDNGVVTLMMKATAHATFAFYAAEAAVLLKAGGEERVNLVVVWESDGEPTAPSWELPVGVTARFDGWRKVYGKSEWPNRPNSRWQGVLRLQADAEYSGEGRPKAVVKFGEGSEARVDLSGRYWE